MKSKATFENVSYNMKGEIVVSLKIQDKQALLKEYNNLKNDELEIEIKRYREKRSLNANSYCWALINKLGNALRLNKDEVYLLMIKRYGQSEMVSILSSIKIDGYFKYYDLIGTSKLNNKEFNHYRIYKGSSEYDTREMAILIDGIVQECEEQNIETLPPAEIEALKKAWKQ